MTATRADGILREKPLHGLRVATFRGHYLLVRESKLDFFGKWGPTRGCCLHQEAGGATIDMEWSGWMRNGLVPRHAR